ncbi:MAG: aminopeptidase [Erysipelotrichaceae bacterium]|nr:aminopeptidase [Erysipelotrichaceae bacterium]
MRKENLYRKFARLAVVRGVNVQNGQPLVIRADVRDHAFVEMIVEEAYQAGAKSVDVRWRDQKITKLDYLNQSEETLSEIGDWLRDREQAVHDAKGCYLSILSDMPGALKDIPSSKIRAYQKAYHEKMGDLSAYTSNNQGQWCVLGVASKEWAKVVFPDLNEDEAFEKLEDVLFEVSGVSEDNDPVEWWREHDEELIRHAEKMTAFNFRELHFTNSLGTDLYVPLTERHIWVGGGCKTPAGVYFDPNIPTEEVFCMPHCEKVHGTVVSSRPLSYNGVLIENFRLVFEEGKVIEHHAEKNEEALTILLDFDEGSRRLGEVALVPHGSKISQSGVLFYNTLYDENASCHLALGRCYPENIEGGVDMSEEELRAKGGNCSLQHEDFMFGTADMNIDGITYENEVIPVFRNGSFVID